MKWTVFFRMIKQPALKQSAGSWAILGSLLVMLVIALWVAYAGWGLGQSVEVPATGYVAMAVGILSSLVVGVGLMALVFYSSREGFDEAPQFKEPSTRDRE